MRTYTELETLPTFKERFKYLKLSGGVAEETFGFDRYLNQRFYHSAEWRRIRDQVIVRDGGNDLGLPGYPIRGKIYIHHMNPISSWVMRNMNITEEMMDPEYLVCASHATHNALHYGDESLVEDKEWHERAPNDTCPWKT